MNNFKKKLMSLLLTLTLLLSCGFLPIGNKISVNAVGDNAYPPYAGGIPTQVVYITDKATSLAEIYNDYIYGDIQNCLSDLGWNNVPINVYPVTEAQLINYIVGSQLNFQNAAIILELKNTSLNEYYPTFCHLPIIQFLDSIIEIWQANGCRVMFINNTEETLFSREKENGGINENGELILDSEFLSNIDIHINADTFIPFADTIVSRLENDEYLVENCIILLDTPNSNDKYNHPFVQFLVHCLRHSNPNYIRHNVLPDTQYAGCSVEDLSASVLLYVMGVQVLAYDEYNANIEDYDAPNVIAVGYGNYVNNINLSNWANFFYSNTYSFSNQIPVYYFRDAGLTQNEHNSFDELPVKFSCCGLGNYLENNLSGMLADFLSGNLLDQYDNWAGKCDVTHKTATFGLGGWMNSSCRVHDPELGVYTLT